MDRDITRARYRYLLEQEIEGSDMENLIDSLEDEEFQIREALGERAMNAAIREGVLRFDHTGEARLPWFGECVRTLSVYLSEYVVGLEIAEGRNAADIRVEIAARKYVGRTGDLIAVPLVSKIDFHTGEIDASEEDVRHLEAHWGELPRWAQDAYRLKFPKLRLL